MNRDLLVLTKQAYLTEAEAASVVAGLNKILGPVENWAAFCVANEIIDINKHKIVTKTHCKTSQTRHLSLFAIKTRWRFPSLLSTEAQQKILRKFAQSRLQLL